jgi:diacylglycerol kinase family enzyme
MIRKRTQRTKNAHYCILVNKTAATYQKKSVERLTRVIKAKGGRYTVIEPESAMDLFTQAKAVVEPQKSGKPVHPAVGRWGEVTALVACGGDGTFNLVARAALTANIPVGLLPMGRFNNIGRSLCPEVTPEAGIIKIINGKYRNIDVGLAADQIFFGSIGLGLIPHLAQELEGRKLPRFGIGWSKLAAKAASAVRSIKTIIKIDAFRFELRPVIFNVNLLAYSVGLPLSTASLPDDGHAEVILDRGDASEEFSNYVRNVFKNKYYYGDSISLYRGTEISAQPTKGRTMYLDGELIDLPAEYLEIRISDKKLKVFC